MSKPGHNTNSTSRTRVSATQKIRNPFKIKLKINIFNIILIIIINPVYLYHSSVVVCAARTLCNIFEECFCFETVQVLDDGPKFELVNAALEPISSEINVMSIKYLDRLLYVTATVMGCCGSVAKYLPAYKTLLQKLAILRESDTTSSVVQASIDKVVIESVRCAGPAYVLECLPLNLDPHKTAMSIDWHRSWLLPVLRDGISQGSLFFFGTTILPLALAIRKRVDHWKITGEQTLATVYTTVYHQLWSLLPSVCHSATDIVEHLKDIAKLLGVTLLEQTDLRLVVLKSIRALISGVTAKIEGQDEKDKETGALQRGELCKFAPNYLSILLNLYLADPPNPALPGYDFEGVKLSVLETIRMYLKMAPADLLEKYLSKALERMDETNIAIQKQSDIMDIVNSMSNLVPKLSIQTVFQRIQPWLLPKDGKVKKLVRVQKKAYRFLEEIVCSEEKQCQQFVEENFDALIACTFGNISKISHPSIGVCLICMRSLIDSHYDRLAKKNTFKQFMHDAYLWAITCLKSEYNVKTRHTAAQLVSYLSLKLAQGIEDVDDPDPVPVPDFETPLQIIWNTVTKSNTDANYSMLAACIMGVRIIVLEYSADIESSVACNIFGNLSPLLMSKHKACLAETLRLLLIVVKKFPDYVVGQYLQIFLPVYFKQDVLLRRALRKLNSCVLRVLILKFGEVCLLNEARGNEWPAMINAVRKRVNRNKRLKLDIAEQRRGKSVVQDDACTLVSGAPKNTIESILEDDEVKSQAKSQKSRQPVWIKEDLVDLLDNKSMIQQVTSTDPKLPKVSGKKRVDGGFKTAKDGRLVIADDVVGEDDSDDEQDHLENMLRQKIKTRKESDDLDDDAGTVKGARKRKAVLSEAPSEKRVKDSYVPGGKGIHRPLDGAEKESRAGGDKRKKGDRMDPFAYEQLDVKSLKRKGKASNQQKFKKFFTKNKKSRSRKL